MISLNKPRGLHQFFGAVDRGC